MPARRWATWLRASQGIAPEKLEIETEGKTRRHGFPGRDPRVRSGFDSLRCTVRVNGNGTPAAFALTRRTVTLTAPDVHALARVATLHPTLVVA